MTDDLMLRIAKDTNEKINKIGSDVKDLKRDNISHREAFLRIEKSILHQDIELARIQSRIERMERHIGLTESFDHEDD